MLLACAVLDLLTQFLCAGKVIITCLPRVETSGLKSDSVNALTDRIRQSMEAVFEVTSAEVGSLPAPSANNTSDRREVSRK